MHVESYKGSAVVANLLQLLVFPGLLFLWPLLRCLLAPIFLTHYDTIAQPTEHLLWINNYSSAIPLV